MLQINWIEILGLLGVSSIISGLVVSGVGALLKWYFDRVNRQNEVFMDTFKRFSNLTHDYYMPMAVLAGRYARLLEGLSKEHPPEKEFAFFNLARFHLYVLRYIIHGGGYLMRDWRDDRIQAKLYGKARNKMPFSDSDISIMQFVANKCDNYLLFKKILDKPTTDCWEENELVKIYKKFSKWLKGESENKESVVRTLRCYSQNMLNIIYDMYSTWYDKSAREIRRLSEHCEKEITQLRNDIEEEMKTQ